MKRPPARGFQDLIVWQKAHEFVLLIYRCSESFPKQEIYGLTSQMRRAAVSIPANIAEGFKKKTTADKARFLNIAQGSLEECRYYLILTKDLGYQDASDLMILLEETSRLLEGYLSSLKNNRSQNPEARSQEPEYVRYS
jgi:four helix bundle protein